MKIETKTVFDRRPDDACPRQSEGSFLELESRRILFAYTRFSGGEQDDAAADIVYTFSDDRGETWEKEQLWVPHAQDDNVMSVSLLRMQNGDVGLFYLAKCGGGAFCKVMLARCKDNSLHDMQVIECSKGTIPAFYVLNNDRAVRLQGGRILLPLAAHPSANIGGKAIVDPCSFMKVLYSDDDGRTWQMAPHAVHPPFTNTQSGLQEPGMVEIFPDALWAYFRTDQFCQYESFSFNRGETWTQAQPSRFSSPLSPMQIKRCPATHALYAIWNPVPNYNGRNMIFQRNNVWTGGRTPLVISRSEDNGATWTEPLSISDHPEHGYCYPALFFLKNGQLLLAYCSGGPDDRSCLSRLTISKISLTK